MTAMRAMRYGVAGVAAVGVVFGGQVFMADNVVAHSSLGQLTTTADIPMVCTAKVNGGLTVTSGQSYLTTAGCVVEGGLSVESGGSFTAVSGVTIHGGATVHTSGTFSASGTTVDGGITVYKNGVYTDGGGNTVNGGVTNLTNQG